MARLKTMTTAEAAALLDCSIRQVRYLCEEGTIEAWKVGRDWQIREVSVKAYAKKLKKGRTN